MTATTEASASSGEIDSIGDRPRPFDIPSHDGLLRFPEIPATNKRTPSGARDISIPVVDAIIVPTFRSAEQVRTAVELASQARCRLLLLYTNEFPAGLSDVLEGLEQDEVTPLVVRSDMRDDHLLDLGADLPLSFAAPAALDISRKRNLGLLIGRMCGWRRVLLLDDDIRRINIGKLSAAAALLDTYPVVGLQVIKYPDASVVGHARRVTGREQIPFISGGSLLIDPQRLNGLFPAIYHEDWLCIINHLMAGEVAIGGVVGQKPYKPFAVPERAKNEEFGDVFAIGLLWLVHGRNKADPTGYWQEATNRSFWERMLDERAALLEDVAERLMAQYPGNEDAHLSLDVARKRCAELTADEFVSVAAKWMSNLQVWRERVSELPPADSVEKALTELGLLGVVQLHHEEFQEAHAESVRRQRAKWFAVGSAFFIAGSLVGAALSTLKVVGRRGSKLLRGRNRGSRLGCLVRGRGTGCRSQRPLAGGDHAEHHDDAAARGEQQPVGVTSRDEAGPERTVQAGGQNRAGDGHAERLADLAAGGSDS